MHLELDHAIHLSGTQIQIIASSLARRGWAEGNGGNLSLRLEDDFQPKGETIALTTPQPSLENHTLILTTTGSRMRDVARDPASNLCLVKVIDQGQSAVIQTNGGKVTSEFPAHLAVHAALADTKQNMRAFLHTHPTHLIALNHLIPDETELTSILVRMFPEAALLLYNNLRVLSYTLPGSAQLGQATAYLIREASGVIWAGHGMTAAGENLASALDIIETADKAAHIALLLGDKMTTYGLTRDQAREIWEKFH